MPPPATPSAEGPPRRAISRDSALRTLGRHQLGSLAATAVDFGAMIACVEALGVPPVAATAMGATLGGVANFAMGRTWIFRNHAGPLPGQAARYAVVSAAGAMWNAIGEHLLFGRAHVQYIVARAIVAIVVSLIWNFPMQREFVFREGRAK